MTAYYVYSGAAGAGTGADWANAYTNLATAMSGKAAGDIFYVADDHNQSTNGYTISSPGSITSPCHVICARRSGGSVPPVHADLRATAVVECALNNNCFINGSTWYNGIIFKIGTGSGGSSASLIIGDGNSFESNRWDNCQFQMNRPGNSGGIQLQGNTLRPSQLTEWYNTTFSASDTGHGITNNGSLFRWRNTPNALPGAAVPTALFNFVNGVIEIEGVDLSAYTHTIAGVSSNSFYTQWRISDCKLNASATFNTAPGSFFGNGGADIIFSRCGSGVTNYQIHKATKMGELDQETTIVRSGGASDGTTPIAWKIVTSGSCNFTEPFECMPIAIWNDTTGSSVTLTIQGIWGGGAVPNDDEVYVEVRYLGSSSDPTATIVNDAKASMLATAAGQTAGSGTWGGSTTKFSLDVTFTPQQKGIIYAYVRCCKPSTTFYIDPLITLH